MNEKKLVPRRRFEEFQNADAWEQRRLGELGSVAMNKRIFKEQTSESGDIPFYKIGTFGGKPDAYISRELFETYKVKYPFPEVGDILISASGSIGRTVEYTGKDEYFQDSNIVWLKHNKRLDNSFLKQFYSIVKWQGLEGSTIKRLYNKNILDTAISVPSLEEQYKVGQFFKDFDNLITLHQRKLEKTKAMKSAYLAEIFPAEGERVPKRRFAGFTDEWKKFEVNKFADRYNNLRIPITESKRIPGTTPYYGANGIQDYVEGYTHSGEFILLAEDGANNIFDYPVQYVNGKVWVNNHAHVLQAKVNKADNKFLIYLFKKVEYKRYLVGGGRSKLNSDVLMSIELLLPTITEQQLIGEFFKKLDESITNQQQKLKKLKAIKQAYLAEMFV